MANISTLSAFMKVDAHKRYGCDTSPVRSPEERACEGLQEMVRSLNMKRPPMTTERFLDLSNYIRLLRWDTKGISAGVARELVDVLTREWERAIAMKKARAVIRGVREVARG